MMVITLLTAGQPAIAQAPAAPGAATPGPPAAAPGPAPETPAPPGPIQRQLHGRNLIFEFPFPITNLVLERFGRQRSLLPNRVIESVGVKQRPNVGGIESVPVLGSLEQADDVVMSDDDALGFAS